MARTLYTSDGAAVEIEEQEPSAARIHSKVGGSSIAGAVSILVVWGISSLGVTVPLEVASAITLVLSAIGGWLAKP